MTTNPGSKHNPDRSDAPLEEHLQVLGELFEFAKPIESDDSRRLHARDGDGPSESSRRDLDGAGTSEPQVVPLDSRIRSIALTLAAAGLLALALWLVADPPGGSTPPIAGKPPAPTPLLSKGDPNLPAFDSGDPASDLDESPVRVAHVPSNVSEGPRVDLFALSSDRNRSVVVLVRGWERGCRCVQWQFPEGLNDSEIFRGTVEPGEDLMVEVDVTGNPPIEQHLVIVTADDPSLLPRTFKDTEELFCCLEQQPRAGETATAAEYCLPNGVAVVTQPFRVD